MGTDSMSPSPEIRRQSDGQLLRPVVRVRPGAPCEAPAIARIWSVGWSEVHTGHVPEELARQRTRADLERLTDLRLERVTVAAIDEAVAGFVMVHDDEIEHLYVARGHRRLGVANALLGHAESVVARRFGLAWLAVVPSNRAARTFYERHDWTDAGPIEHRAALADGEVVLVRARRYEKIVQARG